MKKPKLLGVKKLKIAGIFMLALFTQSGCQVCSCNSGMSNTGVGCSTIMRDAVGLWLQPTYADDGTRNGIPVDGSVTLNQAYFEALANDTDRSKRIYPVSAPGGLKNVTQTRAENVTREFTDGSKEFIREGTKPFEGQIVGLSANPQYCGKLNAVRCQQMSVWKIDRGGNLVGSISEDGNTLYPIQIDGGSFYATFMEATANENNAYIKIGFDFSQAELDQNLRMIPCSSMTYNIKNLRGLIDVCATFTDPSETGCDVTLVTEWGDPLNPTLDQGLVAADFAWTNVTQGSASIGFTGSGGAFTEYEPGKYRFTWNTADQPTQGDELQLVVTKTGRDYTCVTDTEVVVTGS